MLSLLKSFFAKQCFLAQRARVSAHPRFLARVSAHKFLAMLLLLKFFFRWKFNFHLSNLACFQKLNFIQDKELKVLVHLAFIDFFKFFLVNFFRLNF